MKKLFVIIILLIVVVIGVFALAAYNANSLIAHFKPQLEKIASDTLHTKIAVGDLALSVFPKARIQVKELKVSDPAAGSDALSLKDLYLDLNLSALLSKKLEVTKLSINNPALTVVKTQNGFKIAGLPTPPSTNSNARGSLNNPPPAADSSNPPPIPFSVALNSFELKDAKLILRDDTSGKSFNLASVSVKSSLHSTNSGFDIEGLNVEGNVLNSGKLNCSGGVKGLLTKDAQLNLNGKLSSLNFTDLLPVAESFAIKLPIKFEGTVATDFSASGPLLTPKAHVNLNLANTAIEQVGIFTKARGTKLELSSDIDSKSLPNLAALANLNLEKMQLTKLGSIISGLTANKIEASLSPNGQEAKLDQVKLQLGSSPLSVQAVAKNSAGTMRIQPFSLQGFGGEASGDFMMMPATFNFSSNVKASAVKFDEFLAGLMPAAPQLIEGIVSKLDLNVKGTLGANLMNSLNGSTPLTFENGKLKGFNLVGAVLKAINTLPFVSGSLFSLVSGGTYQNEASSPDTLISKLTGNFTFANGKISTKDMVIVSNLFTLEGSGSIGFDMSLDLNTTFIFSVPFSAALAAKSEKLSKVLDSQGRLVVPLAIQGTPPAIIILPNVEKLLKMAGEKLIEEGAKSLLNNALGGGKAGSTTKGIGGLLGF